MLHWPGTQYQNRLTQQCPLSAKKLSIFKNLYKEEGLPECYIVRALDIKMHQRRQIPVGMKRSQCMRRKEAHESNIFEG